MSLTPIIWENPSRGSQQLAVCIQDQSLTGDQYISDHLQASVISCGSWKLLIAVSWADSRSLLLATLAGVPLCNVMSGSFAGVNVALQHISKPNFFRTSGEGLK